jgi:hypothetical protein
MIAGHFGLAAAVKATGTASSTLGSYAGNGLVGCTFVPLFLAKIETMSAGPPGWRLRRTLPYRVGR